MDQCFRSQVTPPRPEGIAWFVSSRSVRWIHAPIALSSPCVFLKWLILAFSWLSPQGRAHLSPPSMPARCPPCLGSGSSAVSMTLGGHGDGRKPRSLKLVVLHVKTINIASYSWEGALWPRTPTLHNWRSDGFSPTHTIHTTQTYIYIYIYI